MDRALKRARELFDESGWLQRGDYNKPYTHITKVYLDGALDTMMEVVPSRSLELTPGEVRIAIPGMRRWVARELWCHHFLFFDLKVNKLFIAMVLSRVGVPAVLQEDIYEWIFPRKRMAGINRIYGGCSYIQFHPVKQEFSFWNGDLDVYAKDSDFNNLLKRLEDHHE